MSSSAVTVHAGGCIRCAACSSLAPEILRLDVPATRALRAPRNDEERARCEVAARICPTGAIKVGAVSAEARQEPVEARPAASDFVADALYYRLFEEAEKARWRMTDLPWGSIQSELAGPELIELVRESAASELTTFTASRRFLQEFADDADFSQWISLWAYEEAKHPHALMRWLSAMGQTFDPSFIVRGRWAAPFARSRVAMLATNVVSEMVASAGYVRLARRSAEPLLAKIAMLLAGDEARHASSFFRYAERAISRSEDPATERATALRVLHVWLNEPGNMGHPVRDLQGAGALREAGFDEPLASPALRSRICDVFARLVGCAIAPGDDLPRMARAIGRRGSA